MISYLSIGTNIGNKNQNLSTALSMIGDLCGKVVKKSDIYETKAWGFESENPFYNIAVEINTNLTPQHLLKQLFIIEDKIGRIRTGIGYNDRLIDIDILFYEFDTINSDELQIPHPLLQARNFVLYPMSDIAPNYIHPKFEKTILELKENSDDTSKIEKIL